MERAYLLSGPMDGLGDALTPSLCSLGCFVSPSSALDTQVRVSPAPLIPAPEKSLRPASRKELEA